MLGKRPNARHDIPHKCEIYVPVPQVPADVNESVLGLVLFQLDAGLLLRCFEGDMLSLYSLTKGLQSHI